MHRKLISYFGMVLTASSVWYIIHTLFGGERVCFDTLAPDDSPVGCSTGLQLFVQVTISSWVSLIVLLTSFMVTKLFGQSEKYGTKISVYFWGIAAIVFGAWHTLSIQEQYGLLYSIKMGIGEITSPYLLAVMFFSFSESHIKHA